VFLITRRRDRKDTAIRIVSDEIVRMFDEERELFE
jgi:hypothetical protein